MYPLTPDGRHGDLPNQTPSVVGEYVDKMRRVAGPDRPVLAVLQGFAWEALCDAAIVYPSYRETRFMAYDAIVHGASGLLYWGLVTVPADHPFLGDLARVAGEIQRLAPAIVGSDLDRLTIRHIERGSSIAAGIEVIATRGVDTAYLIAVNSGIDPTAADFLSLPDALTGTGALTVVGEDRSVPVSGGAFFDEFSGLDVHVY